MKLQPLCVATILLASVSAAAAEQAPPILRLTGDWQVQVTVPAAGNAAKELTATLDVAPPTMVAVHAEKYDRLPPFNPAGRRLDERRSASGRVGL